MLLFPSAEVENETITYDDLIDEVTKLQGDMKELLGKIQKRFACYYQCSPKVPDNPCFED